MGHLLTKKHTHMHTNDYPPVIILLISHSLECCYSFYHTFTHGSCSSGPGSIVFFLSFECMYSLSLSNLSFIKYATCWPGEAQFVIHYLTPEPSLSSNAFSQWADSGYMHCCMLHPCAIIHIFKAMLMVTNPQIIITQICSSPQHYRAF